MDQLTPPASSGSAAEKHGERKRQAHRHVPVFVPAATILLIVAQYQNRGTGSARPVNPCLDVACDCKRTSSLTKFGLTVWGGDEFSVLQVVLFSLPVLLSAYQHPGFGLRHQESIPTLSTIPTMCYFIMLVYDCDHTFSQFDTMCSSLQDQFQNTNRSRHCLYNFTDCGRDQVAKIHRVRELCNQCRQSKHRCRG